jgi:hypothetical protein
LRRGRADGFFKDACVEMDRKMATLTMYHPNHSWLRSQFPMGFVYAGPSFGHGWLPRLMSTEAAREMAVTSIALKRYQLRNEKLPENLNALIPDFLPALPRDPVDGRALRYHPNSDGTFVLYSIGEDAVDNGGDPTSARKAIGWQIGHDWVWPQPATPQEVQHFRANPPN